MGVLLGHATEMLERDVAGPPAAPPGKPARAPTNA
jgi:hypothetical protein